MIKKIFFIVAFLMGGVSAMVAKVNYVPLYLAGNQQDVVATRSAPLFITQDDHKLILPEFADSLTFMILKDGECIYQEAYEHIQPAVNLSAAFVGDYEVRLSAGTYYYYGYITLETAEVPNIPGENTNWDNISLLGSNTSQQVILDNIMGLNVVEYNMKMPSEDLSYLRDEDKEAYLKYWEEIHSQKRFGLLPDELGAIFPSLVTYYEDGKFGINYIDLIPVLISCIQELKAQLDSRTEKMVDIMLSRGNTPSAVSSVRAAIGNTLLSAAPTSVREPALVRFLLTDDATNAYVAVTDLGGHVMTRVPVSPSETVVSIDSGSLGEGIFLCTLFVNGENFGTKRLVKTK